MGVVEFPKLQQEPRIWVCDCGCSTFHLREDGTAQCGSCGVISDAGMGAWFSDAQENEAEHEGPTMTDIQGNGSVDFAKAHVRSLTKDDDVALMVVAKEGGALSAWTGAEDDDQIDWAIEKLDDAKALIGRLRGQR